MSITSGVTGGGSYSNRWTEQAFPRSGLGYTSLGRGNLNLVGFATNSEIAMSVVLLGLAGGPLGTATKALALRGLNVVTKPVFWAGVNAYQEAEDAAAWVRGEDMSWQWTGKTRPFRHPVFGYWAPGVPAIPVPFPYLDFTKSPSTGGGGPGELPNLHQPPPSIEETGASLAQPGNPGVPASSSKRGSRARRKGHSCPPGKIPVWSHRKKRYVCMKALYSSYSIPGISYKFARVEETF